MTWATTEQATAITGVTVGAAVLAQAQAVVDIFAGRTYDAADRIGTRDKGWLKYAVAYQAAWLTAQPDFARRMDMNGIAGSGNGGSVDVTPTAMVLAPMTKWALKRVSWLKSRSLHVRSPFTDSALHSANALIDVDDDSVVWTPMRGR